MRIRRSLLLGALCVLLLGVLAPGWGEPARRAYIESVAGTVKIQRGGRGDWIAITKPSHRNLYGGDHVQTYQRSRAVIAISGARVALGPRTHIIIPGGATPSSPHGIWAVAGKIFLWLIGTRNLEIGTEGAIASARGTKFLIEVGEDGKTTCTVLEGAVDFHNDLGAVLVGADQQSVASPLAAPSRPMRVDPSGYFEWEAALDSVALGFEVRYRPADSAEQLQKLASDAAQAAQAAPGDAAAQVRAGDALQDTGELIQAETAYRRALELAPADVDAQVHLGLNLIQQARPAEAEQVFAAAAAAAPTRADPLVGEAAALAAGGREKDLGRAEELLAKAAALEPKFAYTYLVAGIVAVRRGEADKAAAAFQRCIELAPDTYQAYAYLSTVQLARGDVAAATASAKQAVALAPTSGLAHESLATAAFFGGDLVAAQKGADFALAASPGSATAHLLASDILVAQGDLAGGLSEAQLAVALDPQLAPAYSALGMILLAENDLPHAEKAFNRALELSPKLVAARSGLGVTYARQGKLAEAMEMQKASIALDSRRAATLNNIGAIQLAQGDLDAAVATFKAAIALQPGWAMPRANLALAYLDLNLYADAVHEGELAVRLGENSARVHTTLARVYLKQNRVNKAWASLRRALELDDRYALAHLELAEVYNRLGNSREALNEQLQAVALQPSAILETRDYSRTEVGVSGGNGNFRADAKQDGRGDDGVTSYFVHGSQEFGDGDRDHTNFKTTTGVGIVGRRPSATHTDAFYVSAQHEDREKPGKLIAGAPEDSDYHSRFQGQEIHFLNRDAISDHGAVTVKLGYRDTRYTDLNPNSLMPDPKPFSDLRLRYETPLAEARLDQFLCPRDKLIAGVALSAEARTVAGTAGTPNPPGSPSAPWTPFSDRASANGATFYLENETLLTARDRLMVGGRLVTREGANPVLRPKINFRHDLSKNATLVLLTRPVLRDDVSEISPVDRWALRDWLSPLDLADGGFSQSYEAQLQLTPNNGSLFRVSGFYRTLRNYIVDLDDPAWAAGKVGMVLASGTLRGGEIEWEHWLGHDLSAGIWVRYTNSQNDDAGGLDIPYQPKLSGQLRLDYLDEKGYRVGVGWLQVGTRYADIANTVKLGAYGSANAYVARQFNLHTDLFVTVDNVLNKHYDFYQDYPARGRTFSAGVLYRF